MYRSTHRPSHMPRVVFHKCSAAIRRMRLCTVCHKETIFSCKIHSQLSIKKYHIYIYIIYIYNIFIYYTLILYDTDTLDIAWVTLDIAWIALNSHTWGMFPPRACLLIRELSELKLWRRKGKDKRLVLSCLENFGAVFFRFWVLFSSRWPGKPLLNVRLMRCALPWHTLDITFSLKGHEVHSRMKGQLNLNRTCLKYMTIVSAKNQNSHRPW